MVSFIHQVYWWFLLYSANIMNIKFQISQIRAYFVLKSMGTCVLGSARTGLIFTRIQEGAQPGGLTQPQPGQTEQGIPYHVPSCWVLVGGSGVAGTLSRLGRAQQRFCPRERFCSAGLFCIFPLSVSLLFLFPLFAVLLNCPYPDPPVFCLFLFILLRTPAWGGAAAWRFCCRLQPKPEQLVCHLDFFDSYK